MDTNEIINKLNEKSNEARKAGNRKLSSAYGWVAGEFAASQYDGRDMSRWLKMVDDDLPAERHEAVEFAAALL